MGKPQYLIDTNTVIDYLNDKLPESGNQLLNEVVDQVPQVSVVTKIEVLGFNTKTEEAHQMLIDFIEAGFVYSLDDEVVNQAITLRKNYRIKLPDAIIAATAIVYGLTLISRNAKDFKDIQGLNFIDPHNL